MEIEIEISKGMAVLMEVMVEKTVVKETLDIWLCRNSYAAKPRDRDEVLIE